MKSRSRYVFIGLLVIMTLSLLGVVPAAAAPSLPMGTSPVLANATTGSVAINKTWVGLTGTFKVTVTDSDANTASAFTQTTTDADGVTMSLTGSVGTTQTVRLANAPIADNNSDGIVSAADITVVATGGTGTAAALSVSANDGLVTVRVTATANALTYNLTYKAASIQTVQATVISTTASTIATTSTATTGIIVQLKETGPDTGKFAGNITVGGSSTAGTTASAPCNTDTATCTIKAISGDTITAKYEDTSPTSGSSVTVSTTVKADGNNPVVSVISPANNLLTRDTVPQFVVDVTDGESGLDEPSTTNASTNTVILNFHSAVTGGPTSIPGATVSSTAISSGYRVTIVLSTAVSTAGDQYWYVTATDKAGNVGNSDVDAVDAAKDNHKITFKFTAPVPVKAVTGEYWDTTKAPAAVNTGSKTKMRVEFDVDIDPNSVNAADFAVAGNTVTDASTPTTTATTKNPKKSVFLTLGTSLGAADRPSIQIVGSIADKAGNTVSTGTITDVTDGIKPTVTVTVDKTKISSNNTAEDKATVTITVNEALNANPTVKVTNDITDTDFAGGAVATFGTTLTGTNTYQAVLKASDIVADAVNYIGVTATDAVGNSTTQTTLADTTRIQVKVDNSVTTPTFTPAWTSGADPTEVTQTVVYIKATYAEKVTISAATFNGVSVLSTTTGSQDGKTWTYVTDALAVGSINSFKISATDSMGNVTGSKETRFKVVEPAGTTIALASGWNLISVPDNLKDPTVDVVLTGLNVTLAMTYDQTAGWVTATKDPTSGKYVGSLTKIETGKGYFIFASSPQTLKVYTADRAPTDLPPQIALKKGLNLVGYTSLPKVDNLKVTQYLSGAKWVNVYSYSPDPGIGYQWAKPSGTIGSATTATSSPAFDVDISGAPVLKLGKGYWVTASDDSVVSP